MYKKYVNGDNVVIIARFLTAIPSARLFPSTPKLLIVSYRMKAG
jgi:hypothetical protein